MAGQVKALTVSGPPALENGVIDLLKAAAHRVGSPAIGTKPLGQDERAMPGPANVKDIRIDQDLIELNSAFRDSAGIHLDLTIPKLFRTVCYPQGKRKWCELLSFRLI